ncbi:MAG: amidohydrolase family protein [Lysobacterales bacterium]
MRRWGWLAVLAAWPAWAQQGPETFTPNDVHDQRSGAFALVGASVHAAPGETPRQATVYLRDGRIERIARGATTPGYAAIDYSGLHLYAGFIDLNSNYGMPALPPPKPFSFGSPQVVASTNTGAYNANEAIKSDFEAVGAFVPNAEAAGQLRQLGFTSVLSHRPDGIARGTGTLLALIDGPAQEAVLGDRASAHYSFAKGSSAQFFPISIMGSVALLRQTHLDARWYAAQSQAPFEDQSLRAWNRQQSLPQFFSVDGWLNLLRAQQIANEFDLQYVFLGSGDEYQRLDAVKATGAAIVLPISFPKALQGDDPSLLRMTPLAELQHWEQAPYNPARLQAAGVQIALTAAGLEGEKYKGFWPNLRTAMEKGLSADAALAALTTTPAALLGQSSQLGRIGAGQRANLLVTSAELDDPALVVHDTWVLGRRHSVAPINVDLRGRWTIDIGSDPFDIEISGSRDKPSAKRVAAASEGDADEQGKDSGAGDKLTLSINGDRVVLRIPQGDRQLRLSGLWRDGGIDGYQQQPWRARRSSAADESEATADDDAAEDTPEVKQVAAQPTHPLGAYGRQSRPAAEHLLFRNATVWTGESEGILEQTDVRVRNGRIAEIGRDLAASGAREIDATGRHLTAGIIDEHSHIAASSINDIATNSSMVRIGDALDPTDISIFRNLAGGVTTVQVLHGSANPIGGQSALIKLRWGVQPRDLLIDGAPKFIKFALGENVKAASNPASIRYPGTRMGVAQFIDDAFAQARQYEQQWSAWRRLSAREQARQPAPRRDLVSDAMVEILNGERFISAHSYVQSEILMLMQVAERYGFRVNTFTHILEGYKLADRMAQHGAGGSSFADWWAYKMEVVNAIPYNNALMEQAGVVSAVNSDSDEMSRRLNQEAAKTIKYGGLTPEHAWRLVTLHPAKLLHLDDRMGSVKVGKDADLVLWSAEPLSIQAKADYTLVDGRIEFDRLAAEAEAPRIEVERQRLLDAMAQATGQGAPSMSPKPGMPRRFHCDDLTGFEYLLGGQHAH